jgi:DNA polymerase epsilon subunit 1
LQQLIDHLDRDLHYAIVEEGKMGLDSVTNYDDVKEEIKHKVVPLLLSSCSLSFT